MKWVHANEASKRCRMSRTAYAPPFFSLYRGYREKNKQLKQAMMALYNE
jgi:hypothetical protein